MLPLGRKDEATLQRVSGKVARLGLIAMVFTAGTAQLTQTPVTRLVLRQASVRRSGPTVVHAVGIRTRSTRVGQIVCIGVGRQLRSVRKSQKFEQNDLNGMGKTHDIGTIPAGESWKLVVRLGHLQEPGDVWSRKTFFFLHEAGLVIIADEEMFRCSERINARSVVQFSQPRTISVEVARW